LIEIYQIVHGVCDIIDILSGARREGMTGNCVKKGSHWIS